MYQRISVPIDGTSDSEQALPLASDIARRARCPLDLVTVVVPPAAGTELYASPPTLDVMEEMRRAALERLSRLARQYESQGVQASAIVLDGTVTHALAEYLEVTKVDLVVMTTHDRNRLERLLLGSVANSVVRHVHIPVLLVHLRDGIALVPREFKRILVPLDGSQFGEQVLPHAARFASLTQAEMTLLSVVQPVLAAVSLAGPPAVSPLIQLQEEEESEEAVRTLLEGCAEELRADGVEAHIEVLVGGPPGRLIVEYAELHEMDLIAMTTHGRGALKRLVAGSVSEKVLRSSSKPMLMYRPKLS